jgi:hypothetical protein
VGIRVFVFDERVALAQADYGEWVASEIRAAPKDGWDKPESSSRRLRKWFDDMRKTFPREADPDDSYGTEYCFYGNVIDVMFASSVGEEGVLEAWRLADKHGLRLLVGDELLPRTAPRGKRDFHISVLDGARPKPGVVPDVCFVVFDPELAHVTPGNARQRVVEKLEAEPWIKEQSILMGNRLGRWNDQFAARNLDPLISEMRFYRDLIFIRVHRKNGASMISPMMELSHKLGLPLEVYVDMGDVGS